MKKYLIRLCFLFTVSLFTNSDANAQFVIKVRPVAPVIVRPAAPGPRHIWVDDEWVWRGGRYHHVNGYWAQPRYANAKWIPGHWKNKRHGLVWIAGHWKS